MSKLTMVPLETMRLAQYAVQVPCYICNESNTYETELCRYCYAPMALAHQASSQQVHPLMVAALGASGVGKTVYLGMLMDMLSRKTSRLSLLARGAFSITLQQETATALARGEFPDKTPNEPDRWNWVHAQVRARGRKTPVELIMPDMAGEALLEEMDHPFTYRVIRSLLQKCSGALVLVDALRAELDAGEQDYFTMKLLSYLSELEQDPKKSWRTKPIAIVFTKADLCDSELDDPEAYAKLHTQGLLKHCQERFSKHKFFAAGVAGACALREEFGGGRVYVPLRIEPRGIVEPFEWLVGQVAK